MMVPGVHGSKEASHQRQTVHFVDAFTNRPFSGNPAAVCILADERENSWMQNLARELNLSETAFLRREETHYELRWFTPRVEVDLCGHATLASAHVLWESGQENPEVAVRFQGRSGALTASRRGDWIELDFPAVKATEAPAPPRLAEALGVAPKWVGLTRLDYLVEVDSEDRVRSLRPDLKLLQEATPGCRGVIVTSRSRSTEFDMVSRYFAPAAGVDEDPVTGSAHCSLGPFWAQRLGKSELTAYQASERGGSLKIRVGENRVRLLGQAVTVMRGELL